MNGTIVEPAACEKNGSPMRWGECWENELSLALRSPLSERVTQDLWRLVV